LIGLAPVLLKVRAGNCLTLKKSGLRRCSSRLGLPVSMVSALIVMLNDDLPGSAASMTKPPENVLNRPGTQASPRWEILKVTELCIGSMA
jgi:hypothetical protein